MLVLTLRIGESLQIGKDVTVTVKERDGNIIKLAVDADKSIPVRRVSTSSQAQLAGKLGLGEATTG